MAEGLAPLLALCRRFLEREGIWVLWQRLGTFAPEDFEAACVRELGYAVDRGNRARMLRVLLDLAREAGWLRAGDGHRFSPGDFPGPGGGAPVETLSGELRFFAACLDAAPSYLRARGEGIAFDAGVERLWDGFLASKVYEFARRWALLHARVADGAGVRCLDVGYGTGRSTLALCRHFPRAAKAAVDQGGLYERGAERRTRRTLERFGPGATPVRWASASSWQHGFAGRLPFPERSFDLVLFSCGDPYLSDTQRLPFYRELLRVLSPGGRLCLVTWTYPGSDPSCPPSASAARCRALAHDFAESVCRGWEGFLPAQVLEEHLRAAGFLPGPSLGGGFWGLDGAAWVAERPMRP